MGGGGGVRCEKTKKGPAPGQREYLDGYLLRKEGGRKNKGKTGGGGTQKREKQLQKRKGYRLIM